MRLFQQNYVYFQKLKKFPPFEPVAKTVKNIDTRLEVRPIDLRRKVLQHIFKTRSLVLKSIRDYFNEQQFTEINTPKMIATATEGGQVALISNLLLQQRGIFCSKPAIVQRTIDNEF